MLPRGSYFSMGRQGRQQQGFSDGGKAIGHRTSMGGLVDKYAAMARAVHVLNELFTLGNMCHGKELCAVPKRNAQDRVADGGWYAWFWSRQARDATGMISRRKQ
jgi:hypothetical protein